MNDMAGISDSYCIMSLLLLQHKMSLKYKEGD